MQAIILAGGYGTRLYPLTINAPKPMILVDGKPMIEYLVEKLNNIPEISEIFVVSNAKFSHVFEEWAREKKFTNITVVNDGTLTNEDRLGSVGDIQYVLQNHSIHEDVMILGGDNFFEDSLQNAVDLFQEKGNTLGLYDIGDLEYIKQLSNVSLDNTGKIINFIEKPQDPTSTIIGTLIYLVKNEDLKYVQIVIDSGKSDRSGDFIDYLRKNEPVYGYSLQGKWFDIGTLEQLKKAEDWIHLKNDKK